MLLLTLLAGCRHDPNGQRPGDIEDDTGLDTLVIQELEPGYATSLGGTLAHLSGETLDASARVWLGDVEAQVLEADADQLLIEVPAMAPGIYDVRVETLGGEGELLRGLQVFEDATGLAGAFGAVEWYELQGSYWTADSADFGTAWWGLIEPADVHYWDIFGVDEDACTASPEFPAMQLMDHGLAEAGIEVEGHSFTMEGASDRFFDRRLVASDYVERADYSAPSLSGGNLPGFGIDHLASTSGGFDLYSPRVYGDAPPELRKNELLVEWGEVEADRVMILVERMDQDLETVIETVGCVARNDGSFKVPGATWALEWDYDQWLYIYVGAVTEDAGTIPLNNADSRVAGVHWLLGAATTTK